MCVYEFYFLFLIRCMIMNTVFVQCRLNICITVSTSTESTIDME